MRFSHETYESMYKIEEKVNIKQICMKYLEYIKYSGTNLIRINAGGSCSRSSGRNPWWCSIATAGEKRHQNFCEKIRNSKTKLRCLLQ